MIYNHQSHKEDRRNIVHDFVTDIKRESSSIEKQYSGNHKKMRIGFEICNSVWFEYLVEI